MIMCVSSSRHVTVMKVIVNDKELEIEPATNVKQLLKLAGRNQVKGLAVAVNDRVISRDHWSDHYLKENARVVIITATQGG